jgi:hypothetical protein
MIENIFIFLNSYAAGITVLLTLIAGVYKFWQFVNIKKHEERQKRYETYHDLIKNLNQTDTPGENIKLYRQVAVIYELRNYPKYFDVSKRILQGWIDSADKKQKEEFGKLYDEMKLSIGFMNKDFLSRLWNKSFQN